MGERPIARRALHHLDVARVEDEGEPATLSLALRRQLYNHYLTEASRLLERLKDAPAESLESLEGELAELQFFALPPRTPRH